MKKMSQTHCSVILLTLSVIIFSFTGVRPGYPAQKPVVGEIVNLTKTTWVERANTLKTIFAVPDMDLFGGDTIKTDNLGWAAILLSDETLVQINRNTIFVLKKVAPAAGWLESKPASLISGEKVNSSFIQLKSGEGWFRNKNKNMRINIETPTVTAGIRGTEINMTVAPNKRVSITVLEGEVTAANEFGSITGNSGELITVNPGEAPVKTLLIEPDDAVQWTVTISAGLESHLEKMAKVYPQLFSLIQSRRMIQAGKVIEQILRDTPDDPGALSWLALIRLFHGKTDLALEAAEKSVTLDPESLSSQIILSYCYQGKFELEKGKAVLETVLNKNPDHVLALVNLARLMFGSNETKQSALTIDRAFKVAPDNPELLTLKGFLALAMQKYNHVEDSLNRAISLEPRMGEAYMGLAVFHMRQGKHSLALKEIATAVLLEPRRSVFVSYWAKMLYQIKRFDRALELLDLAESLDPNDPTPHLYKAIIYRDLNYPGKAVAALNHAISLNDNRAVYRSRFLLDQDLAVKNVNLSIIFNQLGLADWARSKSLDSIKKDYRNSSGHSFLGGAYQKLDARLRASNSEQLIGILLQPANFNSLSSFQEYTSFFEQPETITFITGTMGNMNRWEGSLSLSGAVPDQNLAYSFGAISNETDGWRQTNGADWKGIKGIIKWDPTPEDGVYLDLSYNDSEQMDVRRNQLYEYNAPIRPTEDLSATNPVFRFGYHRKMSPMTDLIVFAKYSELNQDAIGKSVFSLIDPSVVTLSETDNDLDQKEFSIQTNIMHSRGNHEIIAGALYYWFEQERHTDELWDHYVFFIDKFEYHSSDTFQSGGQKEDPFYSIYLQDIWQVNSRITLEGSLYWDKAEFGSVYGAPDIDYNMINPRLGIIYRPDDKNVIRMAGFRYIVPPINERIDPSDIAGVMVYRNAFAGTVSKEVDLIWEHEWEKAFSFSNIYYLENSVKWASNTGEITKTSSWVKGAEQAFNIIARDWLGIIAGYRFMDVENSFYPGKDRYDHRAAIALIANLPSGFFASATQIFRYMDMKTRINYENEKIWITDLTAGYQFPDKLGSISLSVTNVFDNHFNWIVDDFVFTGRVPEREIRLTLSMIF